jgi:23S rRNA (cytosine1962-C5)-methyltransferase
LHLRPGEGRRIGLGHPWVFSNEVQMDGTAKALPRGGIVRIARSDARRLGTAMFNPHSLIAARLFTRDAEATIDRAFLSQRLGRALALRERLYDQPFYRLVHGEADDLPGLVIDRYGDALSVQANAAGMECLLDDLLAALGALLQPRTIVLRNDGGSRALEHLDSYVRVALGELDGPVEGESDGIRFFADLAGGQKTGWFYDQAPARRLIASLAPGRRVLDVYCHTGGFALAAAKAGATDVLALDSSAEALALAARAADLNGVRIGFDKTDAFSALAARGQRGERWDVVVCDPPSFVKSKRDYASGVRGYRKLARLAATLVTEGGILLVASCSYHVDPPSFAAELAHGVVAANRVGRILWSGGAGPDHPTHPLLPETAYLKWQAMQLD